MRFTLILVFSILIGKVFYSQSTADKIDSLKEIIKNRPIKDSNRIKDLLNFSYAIIYEDAHEAMKYTDEALDASLKIQWNSGIAKSYRQKASIFYVLSDNLQSLEYCQKALKAGEFLKNSLFDASVYNNMANIYADLKQYTKALEYYNKLLSSAETAESKVNIVIATLNLGAVYAEMNDPQKGKAFFERSLKIAKEENNGPFIVAILNNLGKANEKMGNYTDAVNYYEQAINLADSAGNMNIKANALNNLGIVNYKLGNYSEALRLSKHSLVLAKETGDISWQANAWQTLSEIYEKQNQFARSLDAYKNYISLKDSVLGDEKRQEIAKKEMQFEFEKREAITQTTHQSEISQQKTTKNALAAGAGILTLGGIISFLFYKRKRDAVQKQKEAEFNTEVSETEMKALRSQMNPHFIFNSLNSIGDYISKNNTKLADDYLAKFAKLMRLILENSEKKEVLLSEDLKALELYMQLESLRMNQKFTYEIMVDQTIDAENTLIPPLILQPFVENSIWHGISKKEGAGHILVQIKKEGEMINCIVEDNGIGRKLASVQREETKPAEKQSLGMKITEARINILNKVKKSAADIQLFDLPQGLRVEVKLPLELSF